MKSGKSYLKYLASLILFGTNGIVASLIALNSYEIVLTRTLIGGLFLAAVFALTRGRPRLLQNKKHALFLLVSGLAMGASWLFLFEAYRRMGVGLASLAYYCGPVIVMAASPLLFREKLTWAKGAGLLAVLAGMLCVNAGALGGAKSGWGLFCGVMSAVLYAVMVIFNRKAESVAGLENAMWQLAAGFLTVAVFVGLKQGYAIHIEAGSWLPILVLGVLNTGVGCYFYFSSIGNLPVQTVAVCGYLEPLSAVVFSVLLLREHLTALQVAGAALILGGAAFGELYRAKKDRASISDGRAR